MRAPGRPWAAQASCNVCASAAANRTISKDLRAFVLGKALREYELASWLACKTFVEFAHLVLCMLQASNCMCFISIKVPLETPGLQVAYDLGF